MSYLGFLYLDKGSISHIYDVCQAFCGLEKGDKIHVDYFMELKRTYRV